MSTKTRKGLSYVLGDSNDNENHILPINAVQYSAVTNNFYTGGRDGTVKTWSCNNDWEHSRQGTPNQINFNESSDDLDRDQEIDQDIDERVLKLETAISSNPLPYCTTPYENYNITNNYNIHFDWINDLKLVNRDRDLVSCSSDLSLKLINLHTSGASEKAPVHKFTNVHTDYIKRLSCIVPENVIVSGGLDGKIVLWDLNTLSPIQEIQTHSQNTALPNSIYSLANNNSNLLSTGGPSNTINLYDKRLSNNSNAIKKLIGHQDNIRCLLMNDNFILSGSSDTTIKLWDLRNFKIYKNFDIHDDAVWSLSTSISSSPGILGQCEDYYNTDFNVFYSGDKGGKILKTDLSYLSSNLRKDSVPDFDTFMGSDDMMDEKLGLSTIIAKTNSPIISLCCEADIQPNSVLSATSILVSTELSLKRYIIPDTDQLSKYQYSRNCLDYVLNHDNQINDELTSGLVEGTGEQNDLNSDFYDIVSHLSIETNNFDIQSSFSGNNYPLSVHNVDNTNEVTDTNEYNSMFLSIDGGPSTEFVNTYKEGLSIDNNNNATSNVDITPVEILLNPIPPEQITQIPFNREPFNNFPLIRKSIVAKRLFNNKRHMLVLYLNGDLKIWDIFSCAEIKTFPYTLSTSTELTKDLIENRLKEMENIFYKYQTPDTLNTWCEVDIKSGKLLVTLKESMFNNVEIYYDDLCKSYPHLAYKHPDNIEGARNSQLNPNIDDRLPLANILLNSLFHQYAIYEFEFDKKLREELRVYKKDNRKIPLSSSYEKFTNDRMLTMANNSSASNPSSVDGSNMNNTAKRIKMFTKKSSKNNVHQQDDHQTLTSACSTTSIMTDLPNSIKENSFVTDFINNDGVISKTEEPSNDDSIMSMLQYNKKRYWEKYGAFGIDKTIDSILKIYSNDVKYSTLDETNEYKPLFYPHRLPPNLLIIIFEHTPELGNLRDLCSFHLEDIIKLLDDVCTNQPLINDLRNYLPMWIGRPILYSKFSTKENPKIEFKLQEVDYSLLPPTKTIGGKSQKKIKRLPVSGDVIKLTSHNMLRVLKVITYITERFDGRTPEMKELKSPQEWLVLECKGEELANNLTLQTIRTKIWKTSSEIELKFRRKFD